MIRQLRSLSIFVCLVGVSTASLQTRQENGQNHCTLNQRGVQISFICGTMECAQTPSGNLACKSSNPWPYADPINWKNTRCPLSSCQCWQVDDFFAQKFSCPQNHVCHFGQDGKHSCLREDSPDPTTAPKYLKREEPCTEALCLCADQVNSLTPFFRNIPKGYYCGSFIDQKNVPISLLVPQLSEPGQSKPTQQESVQPNLVETGEICKRSPCYCHFSKEDPRDWLECPVGTRCGFLARSMSKKCFDVIRPGQISPALDTYCAPLEGSSLEAVVCPKHGTCIQKVNNMVCEHRTTKVGQFCLGPECLCTTYPSNMIPTFWICSFGEICYTETTGMKKANICKDSALKRVAQNTECDATSCICLARFHPLAIRSETTGTVCSQGQVCGSDDNSRPICITKKENTQIKQLI